MEPAWKDLLVLPNDLLLEYHTKTQRVRVYVPVYVPLKYIPRSEFRFFIDDARHYVHDMVLHPHAFVVEIIDHEGYFYFSRDENVKSHYATRAGVHRLHADAVGEAFDFLRLR